MKRLWITLVVIALAAIAALPAAAGAPNFCDPDSPKYKPDHPTCTTTTTTETPTTTTTIPESVECDFNDDGVLINPDDEPVALGTENTSHRCELTADHSVAYTFTISDPTGATTSLFHPYVAIRDQYPFWGNICFVDTIIGRVANPGDGVFVFAEFNTPRDGIDVFGDPNDGVCGPNETDESMTYAFTFQTGKAKGGTVQLTMIPTALTRN